jgi:hypothetical protein
VVLEVVVVGDFNEFNTACPRAYVSAIVSFGAVVVVGI